MQSQTRPRESNDVHMVRQWESGILDFQCPLSVKVLVSFFHLMNTPVNKMVAEINWNGRELQFPSLDTAQKAIAAKL